jgi:hypothetical protein
MNMAFQVSPGINISEIDLSTVVPAVATTSGAFAGPFRWGPVNEITLVTSEKQLASVFGAPKTGYNVESFFSAADFLSYSNQLNVVRVSNGITSYYQTGGGPSPTVTYQNVTGSFFVEDQSFDVTIDGSNNVLFDAVITTAQPIRHGHTYILDLSDSSNDGFTFAFEDASDNSEYTTGITATGTPGQAGAQIEIAVTASTPDLNLNVDDGVTTTVISMSSQQSGSGALFDVIKSPTAYTASIETGGASYAVGDRIVISGSVLNGLSPANDLTVIVDAITDSDLDGFGSISQISFSGVVRPEPAPSTVRWIYAKYPGAMGNSLRVDVISTFNYDTAENARVFRNAPTADQRHIVVVDKDGMFTGTAGAVLETYEGVSVTEGAKLADGTNNYLPDVLARKSAYIRLDDAVTPGAMPYGSLLLSGGTDGSAEGTDQIYSLLTGNATGYGLFLSEQDLNVSLIVTGKACGGTNKTGLAQYIINTVCETRKDCIGFISPSRESVVDRNRTDILDAIKTFNNNLNIDSSYGFMDSGYKYRYDKYNDTYVYTPLNGDMAGLCVRTDQQRETWFSPAGYNRGFIKNVVKLAFNPNKAERDELYVNNINPVMSEPGQGVVLIGDKTMLKNPSSFDRINVRRLFIVLEKSIAAAARSTLFEFNDDFTRAQFKNIVEPFLRDVQGGRGITDYKVVCDETNNTSEVIDRNEFVGDIYVKPARSINYIQLNFVSVRTGIEFEEIVGRA